MSARKPGGSVWVLGLLAVVLAGCATSQREDAPQASDWDREDKMLAPPPDAAPPAVAPPAPPAPGPGPAALAPSAVTNQAAGLWVPLGGWCKANHTAPPRQIAVAPSATYALSTPGGAFIVRAGGQSAYWDGVDVRLGFGPQIIDGQPCLHTLDLKKTLEPLTRAAFLSLLKPNPTIVIDPGHGGADSGAKSGLGWGYEKDYTLDWARRLGAELSTHGWRVFLTRESDTDLSLSNRVVFADACQADLFVSLHFNSAAPDQHQAGLETYCLTPQGMTSSVTRGFEDDPALSFPNNAFDEENLQLALLAHRALLQVNGRVDRGVRRARYLGVLRWQHRPAILIEGGYLSNPSEARLIADPLYRQRLAEAVAGALAVK